MASLPDSARALLQSPALAHLVTLNPDGSPQVTVVWAGLDGDEIVAAHLPEHRKVRNIRNDSRRSSRLGLSWADAALFWSGLQVKRGVVTLSGGHRSGVRAGRGVPVGGFG